MRVYVSTGREPVAVPDVRNKTLEQAKADLTAIGLVPGTETRENSPTVAAGTVLGTTPEAASVGARRHDGRLRDLEWQRDAARPHRSDARGGDVLSLAAENLQLNAVPKPDNSCKAQQGSPVIRQSLAPGDVPQHSDVNLTYCSG